MTIGYTVSQQVGMGPHHVFHLGCSPLRGPALVCGYVRISVILRQYVYKTPNFIR